MNLTPAWALPSFIQPTFQANDSCGANSFTEVNPKCSVLEDVTSRRSS